MSNHSESLSKLAKEKGLKESAINNFVEANVVTVNLANNVWKALGDDFGSDIPSLFYTLANEDPIAAIIMADSADAELVQWMASNPYGDLPYPFTGHDPRVVNTLLKFGKRLALASAPWLERAAQEKFWACMDYNSRYESTKELTRDTLTPSNLDRYTNPWFYSSMLPKLKAVMTVLFPPTLMPDDDDYAFSPGAVQDACTNQVCKYYAARFAYSDRMHEAYVSHDPVQPRMYENYLMFEAKTGVNFPGRQRQIMQNWDKTQLLEYMESEDPAHLIVKKGPYYCAKPITVPKSLTSVRVISPEDSAHARAQLNWTNSLVRYWRRMGLQWDKDHPNAPFVDTNQDIQREYVFHAVGDGWATIDASSFSDTVRRDFLRLLNNQTIDRILDVMPTHIKWGRIIRRMEMFGTMGSPLTFKMEMAVLFCGAVWSISYAHLMGAEGSRPYQPGDVTLVGDDLKMPQWAAPTMIDWMRMMSMIPNESKTFVSGYYHEACGVEAWDDHDITPYCYWPRGLNLSFSDVKWDAYDREFRSPIASLASLSNRLRDAGCNKASAVILGFLKDNYDLDKLDQNNNPGTIHGASYPVFELDLRDDTVTKTSILHTDPWIRHIVDIVEVAWLNSEKKRSCWCNSVDPNLLASMAEDYFYHKFLAKGPQYRSDLDRLLGITSPDAERDHVRMIPVHRVGSTAV